MILSDSQNYPDKDTVDFNQFPYGHKIREGTDETQAYVKYHECT